jgi:hypothetical protein
MDFKSISIKLNTEERAALYEASMRECRRPEQHIRFLVRQALGINGEQTAQTQNDAGRTRQDSLANAVL